MRIQVQRILWPTDFSALALHGARYARALRELFGAELHVIHVLAPPLSPELSAVVAADIPIAYSDPGLVETCRQTLARTVAEQFPGLPIASELCFGHPWSGICTYAEQHQIDLIILATHGRSGLRRVLIGSTADRVVQHAPCPVLVVKNPEKDFVDNGTPATSLV